MFNIYTNAATPIIVIIVAVHRSLTVLNMCQPCTERSDHVKVSNGPCCPSPHSYVLIIPVASTPPHTPNPQASEVRVALWSSTRLVS